MDDSQVKAVDDGQVSPYVLFYRWKSMAPTPSLRIPAMADKAAEADFPSLSASRALQSLCISLNLLVLKIDKEPTHKSSPLKLAL